VNDEFDKDAELTAALLGELPDEQAAELLANQPELAAELQGVLAQLRAELPGEVAPLSDARRQAVLAEAAELDASIVVLPPVAPAPVIETNWFRQQLPLMLAALIMLGAGVGSLLMMQKQPLADESEMRVADGPPPPAADRVAMEMEMADEAQAEEPGGPAAVALELPAPAAGSEVTAELTAAESDTITVTAAADIPEAEEVLAATVGEPSLKDAAASNLILDNEEVADTAAAAADDVDFAAAEARSLSAQRAKASAKRRADQLVQAEQVGRRGRSRVAAEATPFAADLDVAPAAAPAPAAPPPPPTPAFALSEPKAVQLPETPPGGGKLAARAAAIRVEYAPSPRHPDRLLLVVFAPNTTLNFHADLVQAHRQLAPNVYEVTLQPEAKRGAFVTVVAGDINVPVPIEGARPAFDQASVAYRMAVLKALDIQAPVELRPLDGQPPQ
jgi:hypothetical protein